ncbi:GPALPP motifs-containing protein 1 [Hypomesus transpacificus]|uniref:GPALPP motifs-containing protein 1 n=1 Tax=Hypomesus transpacificus TaxID=137520 RepID=UPI001F078DD8|nr:GPALPP motifs-containing protein 1 [Hypomesus transpacificus]
MSDDDIIGPALPPMYRKSSEDNSDDEGFAGPALPPGYKAGTSSSSSDDSEQEEVVFKRSKAGGRLRATGDGPSAEKQRRVEEEEGFFGPALPPGFQDDAGSPERPPVLGPALPPGFRRQADDDEEDDDDDDDGVSGPALPPGYTASQSSSDEGEEEEDVIGPMPARGAVQDSVALDFERRAQKMKDKLTKGDEGPEELAREAWMMELPPELQHIGLGARTFKKKSGPANKDRSVWTDTPADTERKARERQEKKKRGEAEEVDTPQLSQKDLQLADKVSKYNESKRGETLINLHKKKMKRKAEEEGSKVVERRAFDRDNDLQVNRFDEAQKQRLLKKSQELNTRFSHSQDRMFL